MANRIKYTDVISNAFYKLPKEFYNPNSKYFSLSNNAKVLYTLMKDRLSLSIINKNNFVNKRGEVYLIMTRNEMTNLLGLCENNIRKIINELKTAELMEEVRQGLNKANLIFLMNLDTSVNENKGNINNDFSGSCLNEFPDPQNLHLNNTNNIKTDINNIITNSLNNIKEDKYKNIKVQTPLNVLNFIRIYNEIFFDNIIMNSQDYIDVIDSYISEFDLDEHKMIKIIETYYTYKFKNKTDKTIFHLLNRNVFVLMLVANGYIESTEAFDENGQFNPK